MLTFNDLMASVGNFLFRWSTLEQYLSEAILSAQSLQPNGTSRVKGSFEKRLESWRQLKAQDTEVALLDEIANQANALRQFRNLLVHGLAGGNSAPGDGCEPHIRCLVGGWEDPTGEVRRITDAELKHYAEAADACGLAFISPGAFNYRL